MKDVATGAPINHVPAPVPFRSEGPQPLWREIPRGDCYPTGALGPLKGAVEAAHDITQAPVAIAAQSALGVASLAVQPFGDVETLGGFAPLSLYCLTVAKSGERKSATDRELMAGLREFEREQARKHGDEMQLWRNAQAIWKADQEKIMGEFKKKAGNRISAQAELDALGPEPPAPLIPSSTATEPTLEGLHKLFAAGQSSLGMFSDEGGQFLGGYGMSADNRMKTVAGLSALWGGDAINRTRAGDGASTLYGRRLATHLMVQPIVARPLLADPVATGQGFLARFLITDPPSAIGTRLRRGHSKSSDTAIAAMAQRLLTILHAPKPCSQDNPQELAPRQLPLSVGARELLWQYYEQVETAQRPGGEFEGVSGFASKSPEQAARIAGVLTLWGELDAPEVAAETMAGAITLAQYYLGEAKRLCETAEISADTCMAEKLRRWLLDSWPAKARAEGRIAEFIVPSDIAKHGPNSLRVTEIAKKHLRILMAHGWVSLMPPNTEVDGVARKLAYRIVRA
jgi:Protein of unknown function (DUF3987)